ncbi:DUF937 domain-containing protein [Actinocorallia longicatena]|uniref:DUF937 domain-containing protein n=1 Tax=Actinocorallia longicatena TaxID=111803 RepID=A0ABP6QJM3_9ACTN
MSDKLDDQIMGRLGDRQLGEIATLLGTDTETARSTVRTALPSIIEEIQVQEPPRQTVKGAAAVAGGGMIGGAVLTKALDPLARKLAQKTGLPHAQIKSVLAVLAPIAISVVGSQMRKRKAVPGKVEPEPGPETRL